MARVEIINETTLDKKGDWQLFLQWCRYHYDEERPQDGYRFIWRRPDGRLQPARGQARIPSIKTAMRLFKKAESEGWGFKKGEP